MKYVHKSFCKRDRGWGKGKKLFAKSFFSFPKSQPLFMKLLFFSYFFVFSLDYMEKNVILCTV